MKPKTLLLLLIAFPALLSAQSPFARQDSLFLDAYYKKDIPRYLELLETFNRQFDSLSPASQKNYAPYRYSAFYNLACTYAVLHHHTEALDALDKAIKNGYANYTQIRTDADLVDLHDSARFHHIIAPLKETGDYLYILGKGARYDNRDQRPIPEFQYQPESDSALVALRKGLRLDSIAGEGDQTTRVLRLLHWMHDLIPHDGQHENPAVKNAMSLIATCRRDHRGLNCRGLAIALNECYLSLGFPSRYVTCMPKDSLHTDPDCHVINIVYLSSLKKWVWLDPTNDAYVMNEKGELLGIRETRQRIIDRQPLILNPDANWNHKRTVTKEDYLYNYMAKNLYMLECPITSSCNLETRGEGKTFGYIRLLPLDYFSQGPDKEEKTWPLNSTFITYHTNNEAKFWSAP